MTVSILIADDHAIVREGIRTILEKESDLRVVGLVANGRDAAREAEALRPDVIVMDIAMPFMNGIEATGHITGRLPGVRVVIYSMHYTSEHVYQAMHAGAAGYILKESAVNDIVTAVRKVVAGKRYFGQGVENPMEREYSSIVARRKSPLESLSRREREILQLVVEGMSSTKIAALLHLSPKSVDTYRSRIMFKLGTPNLPALVGFAIRHGIVSP